MWRSVDFPLPLGPTIATMPDPSMRNAPLFLVLHGMGMNGPRMAEWTGLAERGTQAGFATVFPDACKQMWDDVGLGRTDRIDDAAFIAALVERLVSDRVAREGVLFLVGLSNGSYFAERLARHGVVSATGMVLVSGTGRAASRRMVAVPQQATAVLMFEGTADPLVPYAGGPSTGPLGWIVRWRARRLLVDSDGREVVAAETVAADWAGANGSNALPRIERMTAAPGDLAVDRLSWTEEGRRPVVLYKIAGGGHGWPGGPQYMPAFSIGKISRHLDATGILLDFARGEMAARA